MSETSRRVWLIDRYGAEVEDASLQKLSELLETLAPDGDDEHASISLTDEDDWNLEIYRDRVVFENVGPGGIEVGVIRGDDRADRLAMAGEFLGGDVESLRARPWVDS